MKMDKAITCNGSSEQFLTGASDYPYLIFTVSDQAYGINSYHVRSMEAFGNVTPSPSQEKYIRGIKTYHDEIVAVYDLRKMFNMQAFDEYLNEFFAKRIEDHEHWIKALEYAVDTNSTFSLTTDPHKCALGRWYDNFKTENNVLSLHLKKIEAPHAAVHHAGNVVMNLMKDGKVEEARRIVQEIKATHFENIKSLLSEAGKKYLEGEREITIMVDIGGNTVGLVADKIVEVDSLSHFIPPPLIFNEESFIKNISKNNSCDQILILDCAALIDRFL